MAGPAPAEKDSNMEHSVNLARPSDRSASPSSITLCDKDSQSDDGTNTVSGFVDYQENDLVGVGSWAQSHSAKAGYDTEDPAAGMDGHISDLDHQRTEVHPGQASSGPESQVLDTFHPRNTRSGQEQRDSSSDKLDDGDDEVPKA